MRLRDLIVALDEDSLCDLAQRVIPGAGEQRPELWPHVLETFLQSTGHVEQLIFARRPPVAAILLSLLEAKTYWLSAEQLRELAEAQTGRWCAAVSAGELANRMPEHSRIYRRMLAAAWGNDLALDASEARMLSLLRDELGLLRMDHFLMAHHPVIQVYWKESDYFDIVVEALVRNAVLFEHDGGLVIPHELVEHVRRATGFELSRAAANRLFSKLDSGAHLKSALADFDLATSGSKQDRIGRLIDHFIPPHAVVDAMHISQVRELAKNSGVMSSGPKQEVVARIIAQFAAGLDLVAAADPAVVEPEKEERALTDAQFQRLFTTLKGHELQQLLLGLGLRHSGSKEARVETLWDCHLSESSILSKLKAAELSDLLSRSGINARGNKQDKIDALLEHYRVPVDTAVDSEPMAPNVPPQVPSLVDEVSIALQGVELSSTASNRFDGVKRLVAERLGLASESVGVKYLADPKNYRNRVGEALRSAPGVLLLLTRSGEGEAVLDAAGDRLAASASTHFIALSSPLDSEIVGGVWCCEGMLCAEETPQLATLRELLPNVDVHVAGVPESVLAEAIAEQVHSLEAELSDSWDEADVEAESRVRRILETRFAEAGAAVRTKHVSDKKNLGNRISEGMGAGCSALLLTVPEELVESARLELERQLAMSQRPALAVVLAESEAGGYARPIVATRPARLGNQHAS